MSNEWQNGYTAGYQNGWEAGYNRGKTEGLPKTPYQQSPVNSPIPDGLSYEEIYGSVVYGQNRKGYNEDS